MKFIFYSCLCLFCVTGFSQTPPCDTAMVYQLINKSINCIRKQHGASLCNRPLEVKERYESDSANSYPTRCSCSFSRWEQRYVQWGRMKLTLYGNNSIQHEQLSISLPVFNKDQSRAMVYVNHNQGPAGYGQVLFFRKKGKAWKLVRAEHTWVT